MKRCEGCGQTARLGQALCGSCEADRESKAEAIAQRRRDATLFVSGIRSGALSDSELIELLLDLLKGDNDGE